MVETGRESFEAVAGRSTTFDAGLEVIVVEVGHASDSLGLVGEEGRGEEVGEGGVPLGVQA